MFFEFNEAPVALARGKAIIEPEGFQATPESTALAGADAQVLPASDLPPAQPQDDAGAMSAMVIDDFLF